MHASELVQLATPETILAAYEELYNQYEVTQAMLTRLQERLRYTQTLLTAREEVIAAQQETIRIAIGHSAS